MNFKTIFIANFAEVAFDLVKAMTKEEAEFEIFEDHALCDRFLLADNDDRFVVTPFPIDPEFFTDICTLFNFKNVENYSPKACGPSLCQSLVNDKKLEEVIRENPNVNIISYAGTAEFVSLMAHLKSKNLVFETSEIPAQDKRWTQEFFGSKAGFRQAAAKLGGSFPAMPEGAICMSNEELRGWAAYFSDTGYVQKHNHGLAGAGLKIVKPEKVKATQINESAWPVVIERFIDPDLTVCGGSPNIELHTVGNKVEALYTCAMRVTSEGVFKGIEIGNGAVGKEVDGVLTAAGLQWGQYLVDLGYRGYFEIDFVSGKDKKVYPIEANLRRTGGTHVYETALRLLGKGWNENYIVARNIFDTKFTTYSDLKAATKDLFYKNGEGLIITVTNYLVKNKLGYIVIGRTKKRAIEIEKKFHESCLPASP